MAIIETDMILALISDQNKLHELAVKVLENFKDELALSPYTLTELNMLYLSGKITVENYSELLKILREAFQYHGITIMPDDPLYHSKAMELRSTYNLSYFDSLHAGTAIIEDQPLISMDKRYSKIKELKYLNPRRLI
ncbi:MAG: type II toxin-antitoxin system VapC family toxin [Candidatus Nezhaarchaeales archaeon]